MAPIDDARAAVLAERLWYLRRVNGGRLRACQPLDLPFQTTLRTFANITGQCPDVELLSAITADTGKITEFVSALRHQLELVPAAVRIADELRRETRLEAVSAECRALFDAAAVDSAPPLLAISNRYGFGLLPRGRRAIRRGSPFEIIDDTSCASIGLSMFYGFNLGSIPGVRFLIEPSIRLLAATMEFLAMRGLPEIFSADWWDHRMIAELRRVSIDLRTPEHFVACCEEFLVAHEVGHSYVVSDVATVLEVFERHGYTRSDLYDVDFASDTDVGAWRRLEGGAGSVRDLSFLMGDFLANVAAMKDGMSDDVAAVLRAFNWWLASPPAARQRAVGNSIFLRYGTRERVDELFPRLASIIASLRSAPRTTTTRILEWEAESWRLLEAESCDSSGLRD